MTKHRCPLSLHGVIRAAYDEVGGIDGAAVVLPHRAPNWLHKSTDPDLAGRHEAKLTYQDARVLTIAGATALAQDLAGLAGMTLVPTGAGVASPADLMRRGAQLMAEAGKAAAAVASACADGTIDEAERRELKATAISVSRALQEMLGALGDQP